MKNGPLFRVLEIPLHIRPSIYFLAVLQMILYSILPKRLSLSFSLSLFTKTQSNNDLTIEAIISDEYDLTMVWCVAHA
jgi:hypothetical protein